jgi:hypothetical protein
VEENMHVVDTHDHSLHLAGRERIIHPQRCHVYYFLGITQKREATIQADVDDMASTQQLPSLILICFLLCLTAPIDQ